MRRVCVLLTTAILWWGCGGDDTPLVEGIDLPGAPDTTFQTDLPQDLGQDLPDRDVGSDPGTPDPGTDATIPDDVPGDLPPDVQIPEVVDIDLPYPLCQPCRTDLDCKTTDANHVCIPDGNEGSWCGIQCAVTGDCPDGFECKTIRPELRQCIPVDGGTCPCLQRYVEAGFLTTCWRENEHGRCEQDRRCDQPCTVRTPQVEVCNGIDDDCDGATDDGLGSTTCGEGECQVTTQNCVNGVPTPCTPRAPSAEVCDRKDNDCNGLTDDDIPDLTCGVGICRNTVVACIDGRPQSCDPRPASFEVCNGLDDDCDGVTDNDLGTTTCGLGECAVTVQNCIDGAAQECMPKAPTAEACNGRDDDCDGLTDNGLGTTTCGVGECAVTVQNCLNGRVQECTPNAPKAETCNGRDDDCDGVTDNGFKVGVACDGPDSDFCANGTFTCKADGTGVECVNETVKDIVEKCNGLDDNCDGQRDETGCPCPVHVHGGRLYMFCSASTSTWQNAQTECRRYSYDLASIADAAENQWVFDTAAQYSKNPWWIGLNDRQREGTFVWSNGDAVTYVPWEPGQPNNYLNQDCVDIHRYPGKYTWNDASCDEKLNYVCKRN